MHNILWRAKNKIIAKLGEILEALILAGSGPKKFLLRQNPGFERLFWRVSRLFEKFFTCPASGKKTARPCAGMAFRRRVFLKNQVLAAETGPQKHKDCEHLRAPRNRGKIETTACLDARSLQPITRPATLAPSMTSRKLLAEALGTFTLVFAGTGAIVVNAWSHGAIGHAGIALTFGLVVLAMIHTFGDVSGAHLNPAVTIGFATARRFPWREVPGFIAAQAAGAITASALLRMLFPGSASLGQTLPGGPSAQSFVFEVVLTAILMITILSVSTGAKEKGITAGIAIGSVIGLEAMFAGPVCGASMNPARSLAPAVVSGALAHLWIYLAAPVLGAVLAVPLCRAVRGNDEPLES